MDTVLDMVVDMDMDMDMVMDTMASVRLRPSPRPRLIPTFCMVAMADTLAMLVTMDMPDMEDTHMPDRADMLTTVKHHTTKTLFCNRKWTEQPLLFSSSVTARFSA